MCRGIVLDDQRKGNSNTELVIKTSNQRLFFLRILDNICVQREILTLFHRSTIGSIICFSVIKLTCNDKN